MKNYPEVKPEFKCECLVKIHGKELYYVVDWDGEKFVGPHGVPVDAEEWEYLDRCI